MTDGTTEVLDAALKLSTDERATLVSALIQSLEDAPADPGAEEAWNDEIRRRLRKVEDGTAEFLDWETISTRVRAKLET